MPTSRPTWSQYFMTIATYTASRSSCQRLNVGCVLVDCDKQIISTGYNGAPAGLPHCLDVGCLLLDGHCKRSNHAEVNALLQAARRGTSTVGATAYVTHSPCIDCFRALLAAGIKRVIFAEQYGDIATQYQWATAKDVQFYRDGT